MKSSLPFAERNQILGCFKPVEKSLKHIIDYSEFVAENLLENSSRETEKFDANWFHSNPTYCKLHVFISSQ